MSSNSAAASPAGPIRCSICFEPVASRSKRATARLLCSHIFHLDCIGSEFNSRGVMQCPNCSLVEDGDWRYAAGNQNMDDIGNEVAPENGDVDLEQDTGEDAGHEYDDQAENYFQSFAAMNPTRIHVSQSTTTVNSFFPLSAARSRYVPHPPVPMPQFSQLPATVPGLWATTLVISQSAQRGNLPLGLNQLPSSANLNHRNQGHLVGASSELNQAHQLSRNLGVAVPDLRFVNQQQQPNSRTGAVRRDTLICQCCHEISTSSQQAPQLASLSSSRVSAPQQPPSNSMGYFMTMLMVEDSDEEDDLPVYQFP